MKKAIYRTLERFNDDNSGTIEAVIFLTFLAVVLINIFK